MNKYATHAFVNQLLVYTLVMIGFSGSVADSATGGSGLAANSTTFTLQRPNSDYWNGSAWQAAAFNLAATNAGSRSVPCPP